MPVEVLTSSPYRPTARLLRQQQRVPTRRAGAYVGRLVAVQGEPTVATARPTNQQARLTPQLAVRAHGRPDLCFPRPATFGGSCDVHRAF